MKLLKKMSVVACAAFALASCSDDQTTFDLQSVPGRAIVQGTVNCNYGATYTGGKMEYSIKPVAGLKVLLTIANSQYAGGLKGESVMETETDENGQYSFEVPVTNSGVDVSISTAQFKGVRTVVERKNNKVVTREENVVFGTTTPSQVSLKNYGIEYANVTCNVTSVDEEIESYGFYARLEGTIGRNTEVYTAPQPHKNYLGNVTGYDDATVEYRFEPAPQADLIVYVEYGEAKYTFNATTDRGGNFKLDIPVIEFPADISYRVEAMPQETAFTTYLMNPTPSTFRHQGISYTAYDMTRYLVNGMYEQTDWSGGYYSASFPTGSYPHTFTQKTLIFNPYPTEPTYNYYMGNWSEYSFWVD